ncbi:SPOR domain-containing protein [Roseovarius sp.]|uniref:SPOR domain-containing protein n=1 Tax=Roseovarius sp. TaxID=1486281 RepID=UPI003D109DC4
MAGAAISLALVVGIGVWGYKILVRDVSGVPVVRAAEGPMRIQPKDPGGATAEHQGLAVNGVAADGSAAKPADRLVLAPEPLTLSLEDTPQSDLRVAAAADEPADAADEPADAAEEVTPRAEAQDAVESDEDAATLAALNTLADELSKGVEPMTPLASTESSDIEADASAEQEAEPEPERTAALSSEGLGRSLRPKARPAQLASVEDAVAASVAAQAAAAPEVDPDSIPVGTRMAQLGAFESAAVAEQEWAKLSKQFSEYLDAKQRVIQKAQSGGRTFYRLRAMGFTDLSDARRFCSALVAEKADCIPVVTR